MFPSHGGRSSFLSATSALALLWWPAPARSADLPACAGHCQVLFHEETAAGTPEVLERQGEVHEWWWRRSAPQGAPTSQLLVRGPCDQTEQFQIGGKYCWVGPLSLKFVSFDRYRRASLELSTLDLRAISERLVIRQGAGGAEIPFPHFDSEWRYGEFSGGGRILDAVEGPHCSRPAVNERARGFRAIPAVSLPTDFVSKTWKTAALGGCGLELGGPSFPGYVLAGRRDGEGVLLRAVLSPPNTLFIDVVGSGPDHLELWQAENWQAKDDSGNGEMSAHQWLIRIPSGKIEAGHEGAARLPTVEVATRRGLRGGARLTFKVKLPYALEAAPSVSISVGEGGGRQPKYLLSTSELCFGQGETIGPVQRIRPELARCEVRQGVLEPDLEPRLDGPEALVKW